MRKVSSVFLLGFASISCAVVASAEDMPGSATLDMKNSAALQASALASGASTGLQVNAPVSDIARSADALTRSVVDPAALRQIGGLGAAGMASARLGAGASATAGTDTAPFASALSGSALANALSARIGDKSSSEPTGLNAVVVLGIEKNALGEALGSQRVLVDRPLGR